MEKIMVKKIFTLVLSLVLCTAGARAFAEDYALNTDFSGSNSTSAVGFEKWYKGASYGAALGKLYAETGIFGNGDDNMSVRIESPEKAKTNLKIYLRQSVQLSGDFSVGARLAAGDMNAEKSIVLGTKDAGGSETELAAVMMSTDGTLYAFGEQLGSYSLEKWYGVELEVTAAGVGVYLDGEFLKKIPAQSIGEITYIECLLMNKTSQTDAAEMYVDDVYLKPGAVRESSRIAIGSDVYSVDKNSRTISDIAANADVQVFLSGIDTPNGEKLSLEYEDGTAYTGTELAAGLYLAVSSADGVNRARYYLDVMGLKLSGVSNGDVLRDGNLSLAIDGNIPEDADSVRYFVNGKAAATVTDAPYKAEYELKDAGSYEIYAVVTVGEQNYSTPKVTITYSPNKLPTAVMNISGDSGISYGDTLRVEVTAADEDGEIRSCVLVVDGTEYQPENSTSPYVFTLDKLSVGAHRIYAVVSDNEGATGESEKANVSVTRSGRRDISVCDFNSGKGDWVLWGSGVAASYSRVREDYGLSYAVNIGAATTATTTAAVVFESTSGLFSQATVNAECDFMIDDVKNSTIALFCLNSNSGQFDTAATITNGTIGGKTIEAGSWHHLMYSFNLNDKVGNLYLDGELIVTKTEINTDGTFRNLRFNLSNTNSEKDINFYMDNAEIYAAMEFPYVRSMEFLNARDKDILKADGTVGSDVNKIVLHFNTQLDTKYVTKENFSLYANARAYDAYDVSSEEQSGHTAVILTLRGGAVTSSQYKVLISGEVADNFAQSSGEVQTAEFTVAPAAFDVKQWSVYCGNKKIMQSGDIKKGDEITVTAEFVNSGKNNGSVWLIMAVYNGSELADYRIKKIDSSSYGSTFKVSERFAPEDISKGISVEGYVWSADMLNAKSAYFELAR